MGKTKKRKKEKERTFSHHQCNPLEGHYQSHYQNQGLSDDSNQQEYESHQQDDFHRL